MVGEDRYRLAPVREVRERAERVRAHELAAATGDAARTEQQLVQVRVRVEAARTALEDAIAARAGLLARDTRGAPAITLARIALADRFVARRRAELAAVTAELDRAESAHAARLGSIETARAALTRARAERELVDRHFARWREARAKLAERRED
jgi:chromosome segregation ATPase